MLADALEKYLLSDLFIVVITLQLSYEKKEEEIKSASDATKPQIKEKKKEISLVEHTLLLVLSSIMSIYTRA